jgi:hypothetical protein
LYLITLTPTNDGCLEILIASVLSMFIKQLTGLHKVGGYDATEEKFVQGFGAKTW